MNVKPPESPNSPEPPNLGAAVRALQAKQKFGPALSMAQDAYAAAIGLEKGCKATPLMVALVEPQPEPQYGVLCAAEASYGLQVVEMRRSFENAFAAASLYGVAQGLGSASQLSRWVLPSIAGDTATMRHTHREVTNLCNLIDRAVSYHEHDPQGLREVKRQFAAAFKFYPSSQFAAV